MRKPRISYDMCFYSGNQSYLISIEPVVWRPNVIFLRADISNGVGSIFALALAGSDPCC